MFTLLALLSSLGTAPDTGVVAKAIRAALDAPSVEGARWGDIADTRVPVWSAYETRGWTPFWIRDRQLTPAGAAVLNELRTASYRGLDPADYDAAAIRTAVDSLGALGDAGVGRVDAWLSVMATRFAIALDRGRVDPRTLHSTLRLARDEFDVPRFLSTLASSAEPARVLSALEPSFYQYARLKAVLVTYRLLASDSARLTLPEMPARLRPGMSYAGASKLRRLLVLVGDIRSPADVNRPEAADTLYDQSLVDAVRRFQRRHGFGADGIIGDSTRSRFARTFGDRVRQIELTMERWRWLPRTFSAPPILVNIPAFRLNALRGPEDLESEMLAMDVVVGTAVKNDTPLLAVDMVAIQFQPPWNVPTSIMRNEIRPKAMKDPAYLERERYDLLRGDSIVAATPEAIGAIGFGVRVRQRPGEGNALGRVKFVMPNGSDIYLHDTPSRGLFSRVRRDFSHGCIRVANPAELAAFLLRDHPKWTRERIDSAMAGDSTIWVSLPKKVPVFIVYQSAEVRESGETFFHPDVYGHDRALDRALRKGYPYKK